MKFDHPYSLAKEDARSRLFKLGEYLMNRHGIQVTWAGDKGSFRGKYLVVAIEGELILGDQVVHVIGKDAGERATTSSPSSRRIWIRLAWLTSYRPAAEGPANR
jgi:hypothetical protein